MPPDDSRPIRSVAIYTRVSTRHQAKEGHSLETQEADLVALAERNGWDYEVYREPGRSGETLDGRPALTRLLEDVAQGRVDAVLVIDESRLARDNLVAALIRKVLRDADVMIQTPHGPRDLTEPEPELLSMITAAVAHFEQRQRTAKMKRGQRAAAERGMWLGGPPPFGYRADREGRGTVLRVDPEERVVVERAVHLVVDLGLSTWEAARRLNLEGLGPRRADRWRHQNLRRTLSSDALRGHVVWGRGKKEPYVLAVKPVLPARRFQAL